MSSIDMNIAGCSCPSAGIVVIAWLMDRVRVGVVADSVMYSGCRIKTSNRSKPFLDI